MNYTCETVSVGNFSFAVTAEKPILHDSLEFGTSQIFMTVIFAKDFAYLTHWLAGCAHVCCLLLHMRVDKARNHPGLDGVSHFTLRVVTHTHTVRHHLTFRLITLNINNHARLHPEHYPRLNVF